MGISSGIIASKDRWTLPCGCTYEEAVCEQGKEKERRYKEAYAASTFALEIAALTSAQAHLERLKYRRTLRVYDEHFGKVRGKTLLNRSDEPAVFFFSEGRVTVVPADSGLCSHIGTQEECFAWLHKKYPYAVEVETQAELDAIYNRRYERYWPDLVEMERQESEKWSV